MKSLLAIALCLILGGCSQERKEVYHDEKYIGWSDRNLKFTQVMPGDKFEVYDENIDLDKFPVTKSTSWPTTEYFQVTTQIEFSSSFNMAKSNSGRFFVQTGPEDKIIFNPKKGGFFTVDEKGDVHYSREEKNKK